MIGGPRYALIAMASVHGVPIDEFRVNPGQPLEVGRDGQLKLPTPKGAAFLLRAEWTGPSSLLVEDAGGDRHRIGPDEDLDLRVGPVGVQLRVVRQVALRRTTPIAWTGSTAWLLTVLVFTALVGQVEVFVRNRCEWFLVDCPVEQSADGGWNAEYLARLLREDFEGEEAGEIRQEPPKSPKLPRELPDLFLPAGDPDGPKNKAMGGAVEVAPTPERAPEKPARLPPAPKKKELLLQAEEVGTPILRELAEYAAEGEAEVVDGVEPEDLAPEEEVSDAAPPRAEEEEGWGFQDWMDATSEEQEIELMLRTARHRLRIDPNDPGALALLAYYQYLAEDLDAAEATYDRLIEQFPEDSAAYNNKALVYKRRGLYAKEEGLYRVALALDPEDTTAMNNLAVNLAHQGRHEEALTYMKRLEVLLPGDPYSDLHRAKIHAEMGEHEAALRFLERALAGMADLDTLHHIEFRQDIRVDPSFSRLRETAEFHAILRRYYGEDADNVR